MKEKFKIELLKFRQLKTETIFFFLILYITVF